MRNSVITGVVATLLVDHRAARRVCPGALSVKLNQAVLGWILASHFPGT
jgi:hypothetical protein